jgi:hypothetical protein
LSLLAGALVAAAPPTTTTPAPVAGAPIPIEQSAFLPPATRSPEGIGGSAIFNALAVYCQAGAMDACDDLRSEAPFDSQYEDYGNSCAGRSTEDFGSCDELLVTRLAATPYTMSTTVVQPGLYLAADVQPGIYVSGPISGEMFCSWEARDEWGYTTNSGFASSDDLSQTVTAMMILPTDYTVDIDGDCGPMTLVEAWAR